MASLKTDAPQLLEVLTLITAELAGKPGAMKAEDMKAAAARLWRAAAQLQDVAPDLLKTVTETLFQFQVDGMDVEAGLVADALTAVAKAPMLPPAVTTSLIRMLVPKVLAKVSDMKGRDLAGCLEAVDKLRFVAPEVLKIGPGLVPQFHVMAAELNAAEVSMSLFRVGNLKDHAPELLKILPSLVLPILDKATNDSLQMFYNCLHALVELKDVAPEVLKMAPGLIARIQGEGCQLRAPNSK